MARYPYTLVDVFAERPLEGNLLAVVHDADGIDDATQATLARRLRLVETSFVQTATEADADYRHRIYTVATELPFAGHPSLGTAAAYTRRRGDTRAELVQQTGSGLQRLSVTLDGDAGRATIVQNPATFNDPVDATPVREALGAGPGHPELPAQVVTTGLDTLIVPLTSVDAVSAIRYDGVALDAALRALGIGRPLNCYLVAEAGPGHWRARMFAVDIGGEDPATGSAAGPFGAYLRTHRGDGRAAIDQGVEMGANSRLEVDANDEIRVTGGVQFVGDGELSLPG
jgi:trans-2,3-dihydro-3-hydroxyanthranilate isomerase